MKERELLKRIKILLECSYFEEQSLLGKKVSSIVTEIETLLNSEPETKMTWYQKGYDQGFSDAKNDFKFYLECIESGIIKFPDNMKTFEEFENWITKINDEQD